MCTETINHNTMKMKEIPLKQIVALTVAGLLASSVASAITISGTDFDNPALVASYNGTYNPGDGGYMHLAYGLADPAGDAVVGVRGPLGLLNSLSMSFEYSNPIGTGNAPFAAFGISDNGGWHTGGNEFLVVSMEGNQLNGATLVHVWDWTLNGGLGGDVAGLGQSDNVTLNSILATYGTWEVMRAYAYIGDTGGPSSGSVDINSITVSSSVPDGGLTLALLASSLASLSFFRRTIRA